MRGRSFLVGFGAAALIGSLASTQTAWGVTNWIVGVATSSGQSQAQALPAAPSGVSAACNAPTTSKTIKVTWSAVAHATNYGVYQATSTTGTPGAYTLTATVATTSWTSGALTAARNYWYKVTTLIGTNWASAQSAASGESTINSATPFCVQP